MQSVLETTNNKNRCIETNIETTLLYYCINIESILETIIRTGV